MVHKVIDYFPFFNEKELLELRLNLLKDHVDHFIISELNTTHSGLRKDFICQSLVDEYGFTDKVTVLEVEIGDDDLIPNESDTYSATESKSPKEVNAWVRERLQRDALGRVVNQYNDDDVFILSDCDEIINPEFITYFSSICRSQTSNIIKVPLVLLEGSADKRLYQNDQPVPWMHSLLMCTAVQLKNGATPTQMRSNNMNSYPPIWITENGNLIQDCGWHFTWMGDAERRVQKANSFIHYANLNSINTLSSESIESVYSEINTSNSFDSEKHIFYKKDYPLENLPQVIFQLPRVRDFLLCQTIDVKKKISKFYTLFDKKFGEWGWCFQEKADAIIDCIFEVCSSKPSPICVEIGVYGGKSLVPFVESLKKIGRGVVYGIDPWTNKDALVGYDHPSHQQFWGNIDLERMHNICLEGISELNGEKFVSIIRETSDDAPTLGEIDVLHIDGQHTEQLIKDINKYAVSVVEGGYCLVDDVEWSQKTLKVIPLMESLGFKKIRNIRGCFLYYREKKIASVEEKLRPFNITLNELRCALGI